MNVFLLSSYAAVLAGNIGLMYDGVAIKYGWSINKLFSKYKNWVITISVLSIIGGAIEQFFLLSWYFALLSVISAIVLAVVLLGVLKKNSQWFFVFLILMSVLVWIFGGVEPIEY